MRRTKGIDKLIRLVDMQACAMARRYGRWHVLFHADEMKGWARLELVKAISEGRQLDGLSTRIYRRLYDVGIRSVNGRHRQCPVRFTPLTNPEIQRHTATNPAPNNLLAQSLTRLCDEAIAQSLTRRQALVIRLRFYEDRSIDDIAQILDCSHSNVDLLMQKARMRLRRRLLPLTKELHLRNQPVQYYYRPRR